jgi:hypothetical protein
MLPSKLILKELKELARYYLSSPFTTEELFSEG